MRRGCFAFLLSALCLFSLSSRADAQTGPELIDVRPYAPTMGSSFEQVSLMNGSLQMNVPVWSFKQRGKLRLDFFLHYDSPTFSLVTSCLASAGPGGPNPGGSATAASSAGITVHPNSTQGPACNPPAPCKSSQQQLCLGGYEISSSPTGAILGSVAGVAIGTSTDFGMFPVITSEHTQQNGSGFPVTDYWSLITPDLGTHQLELTNSGQWRSDDGTGWVYQPNSCTLTDNEGTRYVFQCSADTDLVALGGYLAGSLLYEEDTNGNRINLNYGANNQFLNWTDTENRTIYLPVNSATPDSRCPTGSTSSSLWAVPGISAPALFCTGPLSFQTNFLNTQWIRDGYQEAQGSVPAIWAVILPDGDEWKFTYTPQIGDPNFGTQYNYGELTRIDLPTGGAIRYFWNTVVNTCSSSSTANQPNTERRGVNERDFSINGQNWTESWKYNIPNQSLDAPYANFETTVIDPYNNQEVHYLTNLGYCSWFDTRTDHFDSAGNLLRTDETDYTPIPSFAGGPGIGALPIANRTIWPDGFTKGSTYTYDSGFVITSNGSNANVPYGLKLTQSDYGYGYGAPGTLLRSTVTDYWSLDNSAALAQNILAAPSSVAITDAVTGARQNTTYGYDETGLSSGNATATAPNGDVTWDASPPGSVRGNQTSATHYLGSTPLATTVQYNDTGTIASVVLPSNSPYPDTVTTYQWSGTYDGGVLTGKTDSLGHTSTYGYDPLTLSQTSEVDENSNTTTYSYYGDGRLHSIILPADSTGAQGETDYNYISSTQIEKRVKQDASTWVTTEAIYDGLGRPTTTQLLNACLSGYVETDTAYDLMDRVLSVTNPYCQGTTTDGTTYHSADMGATPGYDALGRPTMLTLPDGNQQTWSYKDDSVTFTDEAHNSWTRTSDALGRLAQVVESGTLITNYTYDAFGNLTYVNQLGNSANGETPRTRSFTYDSLSRLITSQNPETGTICYGLWSGSSCTGGYDAHGNLLYKTDANGLTTSYTYDALNRVLTKDAPDDSTKFHYTYDQCFTGWWFPCSNPIGRLVGEGTSDGISGTIFAYDAMGRTTNTVWWRFEYPGWYGGLDINYDLAGNPVWIGYPDGRAITQSYDTAGRLTTVTDATTEPGLTGGGTVYFSNPQYTPAGALASATYGNGVTENITYNSRLQPCHTVANSAALAPISGAGNVYDRLSSYAASITGSSPCGAEPGNNGNIAYIADNVNPGWTQSFTYDGLNRLTSAFRSDGAYNHSYNYDSFGNLTVQDNVNSNPSYSIDAATNRLNRWNGPVNLYGYDAAGNLISSGTSDIGGHTFTYNASSQITAVDNGSTATYLYNGIGERTNKATPSGWTAYIYLNGQPMSENSIMNGTGDWTDYIYANGQKVARVTTPIYGGASTTNYYLDDHLGTTQVELDASGNVNWQGQFTPFGVELPDGSTSMHYKFTGKERDAESGLDFFGARFYGSAMGRWVSPDWADKPDAVPYSKLDNPQTLNLYGYVGNNPLSRTDADGHQCDANGQNCNSTWDYVAGGMAGLLNLAPDTLNLGVASINHFLSSGNQISEFDRIQPDEHAAALGFKGGTLASFLYPIGGEIKELRLAAEGSSVLRTAMEGGAHSGFLANYLEKSVPELEKGISSLGKQIAEHEEKLAHPEAVVKDWATRSKRYQEGLLKKWRKDIGRQKEQQEILQRLKDAKK